MGLYQAIRKAWKKPAPARDRLVVWRREPATVRVRHPTRLDRARTLGYRAKPGFVVVRQRVERGGRRRPDIKGGRRSKHARQLKILDRNYQAVAEERASRKHPNMEVLNSYPVGKDGMRAWYEVILVDGSLPEIKADKIISWIGSARGRAQRGLTSAGRKSRGLRHKGKGAEKVRPSRTADYRRKRHKKARTNTNP